MQSFVRDADQSRTYGSRQQVIFDSCDQRRSRHSEEDLSAALDATKTLPYRVPPPRDRLQRCPRSSGMMLQEGPDPGFASTSKGRVT